MFWRGLEEFMFNGLFVPLFSRLQTYPVFQDTLWRGTQRGESPCWQPFSLCLEKAVRHCVMGIPGLPAALLHQGYCSIRFKSPGSLRPGSAPQHFPLRLSISHQNGWLFLKKGHSNELGLVGQGWPEELIDCLFTFPTNFCLPEGERVRWSVPSWMLLLSEWRKLLSTAAVPYSTSGCLEAKWFLSGSSNVQLWLCRISLALWRYWLRQQRISPWQKHSRVARAPADYPQPWDLEMAHVHLLR